MPYVLQFSNLIHGFTMAYKEAVRYRTRTKGIETRGCQAFLSGTLLTDTQTSFISLKSNIPNLESVTTRPPVCNQVRFIKNYLVPPDPRSFHIVPHSALRFRSQHQKRFHSAVRYSQWGNSRPISLAGDFLAVFIPTQIISSFANIGLHPFLHLLK
jgi:hypothetical protein